MVASVGADCLDARALRGVSIVPLIAHAKNKNIPLTSRMNFFPALSSHGVLSIGFANCSFMPFVFLMLGVAGPVGFKVGGAGNVLGPSGRMLASRGAPCAHQSPPLW